MVAMENTSILEFHMVTIFISSKDYLVPSVVFFFLIYFLGIAVNIIIIILICLNPDLYTPMYLFLCNLSFIDLCYITVIVPKLLYILLTGDSLISFTQCFIQMYFFFITGCAENTVIFIMAYDRYVAICHPLHYHHILNTKKCTLLMLITWFFSLFNASLITSTIRKLFFCSVFTIHQLFCDTKALVNIACGGAGLFYNIIYAELFLYGFCPVMCNLMSYIKIMHVILNIKSKDGRRKAFSTCSAHLIVMTIYYGSAASVYLMPPSDCNNVLEQILTVFYTTVVPVLNPLIYSLRNKEIKGSLMKHMA